MLDNFDINSSIQIAMLLVISAQLYFLHKTHKADHERRKKQATVEYINSIRNDYRALNDKLIDKFSKDPIKMARAMNYAVQAGRLAYRAGRIPKKLYATASSPEPDL